MQDKMSVLSRFALVENYPLYVMLGLAGSLAAVTSYRHMTTDTEITVSPSKRDYENTTLQEQSQEQCSECPNANYVGGFFGSIYKAYTRL